MENLDNLLDINFKEYNLTISFKEKWNRYYESTLNLLDLTRSLKNVKTEYYIFVPLFNHCSNYFYLGTLSLMRRHSGQAFMNLRQAIEAAILAAYSLYNNDIKEFSIMKRVHDKKFLTSKKSTINKARNCLDQNHHDIFLSFKKSLNKINSEMAHANLAMTETLTRINIKENIFSVLQFDSDIPEYFWGALVNFQKTIIDVLSLIIEINKEKQIITFIESFDAKFAQCKIKYEELETEIFNIPVFKDIIENMDNIITEN